MVTFFFSLETGGAIAIRQKTLPGGRTRSNSKQSLLYTKGLSDCLTDGSLPFRSVLQRLGKDICQKMALQVINR